MPGRFVDLYSERSKNWGPGTRPLLRARLIEGYDQHISAE